MRYLLALLPLLMQDWGHQERSGLDTGDLAAALEEADKEVVEVQKEARELRIENRATFEQLEILVAENGTLKWELERAGRHRVINALERVLLQRLMEPVDRWLAAPMISNEPLPLVKEGQRWYVLVIQPRNALRSGPLWVKFYLDAAETDARWYAERESQFMAMSIHAKSKRRGLIDVLERHLVLSLGDPEAVETMIDGTPHLYRLVTKDSDVDKLRKEDLIY